MPRFGERDACSRGGDRERETLIRNPRSLQTARSLGRQRGTSAQYCAAVPVVVGILLLVLVLLLLVTVLVVVELLFLLIEHLLLERLTFATKIVHLSLVKCVYFGTSNEFPTFIGKTLILQN